MAGKRGLQQKIRQEVRKRQEKPRPQPVPTGNVRRDRWDEITRRHADVLQNIEFTLVDCWRTNAAIDDAMLHVTLVAAMRDDPPENPLAQDIFERLRMIRAFRVDVDSESWLDCLRVVDQSVRDHSSLRRGDVSYLVFILPYIAPALGDDDPNYQVIEGRVSPPLLPPDASAT